MRRLLYALTTLAFFMVVSAPVDAEAWNFEEVLQKYRERFMTGGSGQVGTVKVQARMLLAKDGSTQLEVTTGEFESTVPATGLFVRIKVSALTATGKEAFSYYFYPLGETYFKQKLTGLAAGQRYAIEAYAFPDWRYILFVNKIKVQTVIQKRADLLAERIDSPLRLPAGIPVQVVGVLTELNGQIGARTDCVLYANGVEVDRSPKIWVDSGDTVSCAFAPTLTTLGSVTLKLAAESVTPGDWDVANNSVTKVVEILNPTQSFQAAEIDAVITDINNTTYNQFGRFLNSTLTGGYDWAYQETVDRNSDGFVYGALTFGVAEVPSALSVTATDGVASWALDRTVPNCFDYSVGVANGRTFYAYVTGCGNLYVEVGSFAGTVTYASRLLVQNFIGTGPNAVYTGPAQVLQNNVTTEVSDGENLFHGDVWTVDVAVTAGPFVYNLPVTVILDQTFDQGQVTPATCTTTSTSLTCTSSSWRIAGRSGTATVSSQP
jgi:hypothetical protein